MLVYASYDYNDISDTSRKNKGNKNMLETSQERVKLLKAGISTKTIEQLYLNSNCFKLISIPVLFDVMK